MKPSPISVAMFAVSLLFAPTLLAQLPDSANQSAVSPAQSPSTAEVPRLIKFSGTLLDVQDRPMAGPVGVTFALYSQQTGGAALWLETQNVKSDASGVYTVLLGANSANGVPAELFASGEARWLEVQVERQAEQPRVLLVSVPYALKAKDAETLGGKPASAFVTTETIAGTGNSAGAAVTAPSSSTASTALPSSKAQTTAKKVASTPQPAVACTSVTSDGTATANSVAKFTAACNIQNSAITETGGNVGIGTAAPAVALDILGNNAGLRLSGTGTHQVTVTGATSGRLGQDANGFFFASDTNGKTVRFLTNNGTLNEWMRITSAGNVGVGTLTPTQKLEVTANSTSTGTEAVRGEVVAQNSSSFNTVAVHGLTNSGGGRGVVGEATSGTTTAIGVQGLSSSDAGIGVSGIVSAGGSTVGVQGEATAGPVSGNTIGVRGVSASNFGTGVQGEATSTSGFGVGVHGLLFGTTGTAGLFSAGPGATLILGQSSGLNMFSVGSNGDLSLAGNLSLPATTNASTGVIMLGNQPFAHSFGGNTFVGQGAGNFTMTGNANTASGVNALLNNTSGSSNTASGLDALQNNTTGSDNSAGGVTALQSNTTGSNNAAFGNAALQSNMTGHDNTASGVDALFSNTIGIVNTASGVLALSSNTTGSGNTAIGYQAGVTATFANANTTGSNNTFIGFRAGPGTATQLTNATAIGENALVSASNALVLGGTFADAVKVGIGVAAPIHPLQMADGAFEDGGTWTNSSDRNLKEGFAPVDTTNLLIRLNALPMQTWKYKTEEGSVRHLGPMAQDFYAAFGLGLDDRHISTVDEGGVALAALQGLYRQLLEKDAQVQELTEGMTDLKARLTRLETQQASVQDATPERKAPQRTKVSASSVAKTQF